MKKLCTILIAVSGLLAFSAPAQVTNVTFTKLGEFETQPGTVIVKGAGPIGSMAIGAMNVVVISKESTDVNTSRKEYGVAVEFKAEGLRGVRMLVDYDELAPLLNGLNYLAQIDSNVTTLPTFVASYMTKSGLRIGAYTSRRQGAIQYFLQDRSISNERILITSAQLAQFRSLLQQAKQNLDSLRSSN